MKDMNFITMINAGSYSYMIDPTVLESSHKYKASIDNLYHTWVLPNASGTRTPMFIDTDIENSTFTKVYDDYVTVLDFENKYNRQSRDMYEDWSQGEIRGGEYTTWLNAYLRVWDKVQDAEVQTTGQA